MSSKVKVGINEAAEIDVPDTAEMAVVKGDAFAVAAPSTQVGAFDLGDDESTGNASRPSAIVHIAHNLSDKEPEGCPKGSVWLSRKSDLTWPCMVSKLGAKFRFVPFAVSHAWREVVPFGTGVIPREWATKQEALAAGRICDFQPAGSGKMRDCAPYYKMWALVEAPENVNDDGFFYYQLGGKNYAPAEFWVDKGKSYVSLKSTLQSAMTVLSAKLGVPPNKVDLSGLVFSGGTEMRDIKVESSTRKIPYMFFDIAKDERGVLQFTTDEFKNDLKSVLASMSPEE